MRQIASATGGPTQRHRVTDRSSLWRPKMQRREQKAGDNNGAGTEFE